MLVWLASYPRSGNTLVRQVLEAALGVPTLTIYPNESIVGLPERRYIPGRYYDCDPLFVKTHSTDVREIDSNDPAFYIVRDGRDTLVSQALFEAQYSPYNKGRDPRMLLREFVNGTDNWHWSHHVELWHARETPYITLRYEDLLVDPVGTVSVACRMFGIDWPARTIRLKSFAKLHEENPNFYRSGKTGQWRKHFDAALHERFWRNHGHAMTHLGYANDFDSHHHSQEAGTCTRDV